MTEWSILDTKNRHDHTKALAFFDPNGGSTIQRYDVMKYRALDRLSQKALGWFWRPEETDLTKDGIDFKHLTPHEKHIFTSNIRRQIVLDSCQSAGVSLAFLPIVGLPELESWIQIWSFSELIHSRSYTHIIRSLYPDPEVVFDGIMDVKEIVECATDITHYYDKLVQMSGWYRLLGEGTHSVNGKEIVVDMYELKKLLWLTIMSVNILEGLRFYASFASSFNFLVSKKVLEGSVKIVKFICRDENSHLASTQLLLKLLPKDDPVYAKISEETRDISISLFKSAVEQEKEWAKFLFKDGSMIGLNEQMLCEYLEYICNSRMNSVNLPPLFKYRSNPLPWMDQFINGSDVQVAPQEVEQSSYTVGSTTQDVTADTFSGFSL